MNKESDVLGFLFESCHMESSTLTSRTPPPVDRPTPISSLFAKLPDTNPSTNTTPNKKRKINSPPGLTSTDAKYILDRLNNLESKVLDLSSKLEKPYHHPKIPTTIQEEDLDFVAIHSNLDTFTKEARNGFYANYGLCKNLKDRFTKETLAKKLPNHDFETFKTYRNKLTFWLKLGLGTSRQLEDLLVPLENSLPLPPLLATGTFKKTFETDYNIYLKEMSVTRLTLHNKLFTEANSRLMELNAEVKEVIESLSHHTHELIFAKAFRAAVSGASFLFRRKFDPPADLPSNRPAEAPPSDDYNTYTTTRSIKPLYSTVTKRGFYQSPVVGRHQKLPYNLRGNKTGNRSQNLRTTSSSTEITSETSHPTHNHTTSTENTTDKQPTCSTKTTKNSHAASSIDNVQTHAARAGTVPVDIVIDSDSDLPAESSSLVENTTYSHVSSPHTRVATHNTDAPKTSPSAHNPEQEALLKGNYREYRLLHPSSTGNVSPHTSSRTSSPAVPPNPRGKTLGTRTASRSTSSATRTVEDKDIE